MLTMRRPPARLVAFPVISSRSLRPMNRTLYTTMRCRESRWSTTVRRFGCMRATFKRYTHGTGWLVPRRGWQFLQGAEPNCVYGPPGNAVEGGYSNWRGGRYAAPNQVGGDGQFGDTDPSPGLFASRSERYPVCLPKTEVHG